MKSIVGVVKKIHGCNVRVQYEMSFLNQKYKKRLKKMCVIQAHTNLPLSVGDIVEVMSCPPVSKTKRHVVIKKEVV